MPEIPEIKGSCFVLRGLNPKKDKESFFKSINEPDIIDKFSSLEYPFDEKQWNSLVDNHKKLREVEIGDIHWMICIDDECIGGVSLIRKSNKCVKHVGEIDYWIAKRYWGKGIVSEAVSLVCDYAFNEFGLMKLKIGFLSDNIGSRRVAEKNGFKTEYTMIDENFIDGEYKDFVYTSRFRDK
jgi:RimJ/RimL family protein N-acetyltransferase